MLSVQEKPNQSKMSLKFYDPELERRLREYIAETESTNNAVLNDLLQKVFEIPSYFSDDVGENLGEVVSVMTLDYWEEVKCLREQLQSRPLTRNVSMQDVVACIQEEGIKALRRRLDGDGRPL